MPKATHLDDYLRLNASRMPDKPALVSQGKTLSWAQLEQLVDRAAASMAGRLTSRQQEVVGLLMPNSWQYIVSYLAIIRRGHIALPIDVIYKPLEIDAITSQIKPRFVVSDLVNYDRLDGSRSPKVLIDDLLAAPAPKRSKPHLRLPANKQIASLIFTSGTTGRPKAAPYTHANHLWNIEVCSKLWGWNSEDSLLISLRLSHWYGLVMGLSGALYHGNTMYLQDRFSAEGTLKMLASGKITLFTHGPSVYTRLLEVPDAGGYDLSAVRLFISGSGPLSPSVWRRFKKTFGAEILEVYGSSETGRIASNLPADKQPGSPGRIIPGVRVKISEDNEVLVKSPGVFPGYWHNIEATRQAQAPGGWWRTNDAGEIKDGRLYLRGRLQETIRKNGYTVSPRDVEWALHSFAPIREAYVVGHRSGPTPTDEIIYFLVTDAEVSEIKEFCRANLPSVWRPDKIILLDRLPLNANGKPHLAQLKAMVS